MFKRWKDGIRIWPKQGVVKAEIRSNTEPEIVQVAEMVKAKIVSKVNHLQQYRANFFLVDRANKKFRPITNYSKLSKLLDSPSFQLPNLFQIAQSMEVSGDLWFTSLDVKQAFYNIPLHPDTRHVTGFVVDGQKYMYNVLPFGIGIAPFVAKNSLKQLSIRLRMRGFGLVGDISMICSLLTQILDYLSKPLLKRQKIWMK